MYKEILQELSYLWTVAVRERDEASERLQNSISQISQLQTLFNTILLSEEQQVLHYYHPGAKKEANHFSGDSPSRFSFASPLDLVSNPTSISSPAISEYDSYSSSSNQMGFVVEKRRDYETVLLETIGGVLPENGKFLQAVIEAGPLLESLLITGPIPKWNNPPVLSNNTGHWVYGGLELGSGMLNRSFPGKMSNSLA